MSFLLIVVYASPCSSKRKVLWPYLAALNPNNNVLWLIDFLFTKGMNDLEFHGPPFTWSRGSLSQCLDRCVVNSMWFASFVNLYVLHLDILGSDHMPLLGSLGDVGYTACNRPFRFIEAWQSHPQFEEFLCHTWSPKAS
ncbi:hypothetical protein V6N11_052963 [Hibiscus sabdariffa]|uniref:Endonuclease/exonuclease/phosphatase domain-containing protein n=1 Tax=Hibiscus sabdariffa TaxID=183260 RepID=A0ABR2UC14_9ROSI